MLLIFGTRADLREAERATDGARPRGGGSYKLEGAALVRELLVQAGLSQRGAARELDMDERTMRRWCSGETPASKMGIYALKYLVELRRSVT